jgi:hypothetical protein
MKISLNVFDKCEGNDAQSIYLVPQYDLVAAFIGSGDNAEFTPPNTIMANIELLALMEAAIRTEASSPPCWPARVELTSA